jgi:membrane-bound lytic murein transglycosylase D
LKNYRYLLYPILIVLTGLFVYSATKHYIDDKLYRQAFHNNYRIFSVPLPARVDFCGEDVPIDVFYVKEGLERELLVNVFWNSSTLLMLKRTYRWFPVIEPILKKNEIPDDFKYLALAESGFTLSVSPAGAAGFWQFTKATALQYGLEINNEVDERYHVEKATQAACDFLLHADSIFNNWTLAAAAYNMGEAGLKNQIDFQGVNNYYHLALNQETSRYLYRIIALKLICNFPSKFGYYLRLKDLYPFIPTYQVKVDSSLTNLSKFAHRKNISYKVLKEFNPWLRDRRLNNKSGKAYKISLPVKGFESYNKLIGNTKNADSILIDTNIVNFF